MQIDAIKKACKMSVALDRAILGGESKEIKELSGAYQNFIKTAKIDEIITAASQDVISSVADLVEFIEANGYKFKFYDGVERDIVDKSIQDIKDFVKRLVLDATGLEIVFESINNALKKEKEIKASVAAYERVPLEDLYEKTLKNINEDFDNELQKEPVEEIIEKDLMNEDDEDYGFF
jgi:hypothetical protein